MTSQAAGVKGAAMPLILWAEGRKDNEMARKQAADFEEKQRGILDKAAQVFAEQGMEKASMSQIAVVAQVSKALLYHYYPSKDALIFAIIITHLEELEAAIEAEDQPSLPPQERLRKLVGAVLENYRGADNEHKVQLNAVSYTHLTLPTSDLV